MSLKDDLEDGEIDETRNNDSDSRFALNFNAIHIESNQTIDNHLIQTNANNISPIFQSMLSRTSDSLFGSSDTDLRFVGNQFNNDCDLREMQANNQSIRHPMNRNNNNNNNLSYIPENLRKPNLLINTTNDCHSSVRRQLIDSNNCLNLMPNNNLRLMGSHESHPISSPFQMRPQLRLTKTLLPTPIIPLEPIQTPFQQFCPPIRPPNMTATNPPLNPQLMSSSYSLSHSNQLLPQQEWALKTSDNLNPNLFTYSTYLSRPMPMNSSLVSQTDVRICDSISAQRKSNQLFETQSVNVLDKTLNEATIVLDSEEIEEVQMFDECVTNGSQSPYDPEQEITYIPPLSPPFLMSNEAVDKSHSNQLKAKDEIPITSQSRSQLKSNETIRHKSNNFSSYSGQHKRDGSTRSESEERKERFNRLLKSNSIDDKMSPRSCPKPHPKKSKLNKDRDSKSPKTCSKVSSRSPVRKDSHRVPVHRESCRKAKNRRNLKRIRKKQVFTQIPKNSKQSNDYFRPKSRNEIQDASYEDLLEEYKRIQSQLKDLEKEEENDVLFSGEVIHQNVKSVEINQINDDSKDDQIMSEDDDELELRRLALESKKIRVQTPVDIDSESFEYEELDENVLREQLLKSLLKAKSKSDSPNTEDLIQVTECQSDLIKESSEFELISEGQTANETLNEGIESSDKIETPVVPVVKPKLIINFGDDSSDDEQEIVKTSRKVVTTSKDSTSSSIPVGLESFLRQARLRSEPNMSGTQLSSPRRKSGVVGKLSITQQKEYQKLKAEIARREKYQVNSTVLNQNEIKWKTAKTKLQENISKVNALKMKVVVKRNALRKAQQHARKMQEQFIAATRVVSATAAEFHSLNDELKNSTNAVTLETNNVNQFEKQCIRIGLKLQGNTYKLPIAATVKRTNKDSISLSKKRTKSETIQLTKQGIADEKKRLQELERIYSKRLQDLKNTSLLRPSSPKMVGPKSPQIIETCDLNIEKTLPLSKVKDSQKALQKLVKEFLDIPQNYSLISLDCFIELMFSDKVIKPLESNISVPEADFSMTLSFKSDSNVNIFDSVLSHLHSYRLIENQPKDISSDHWTNNLNPSKNICRYDLLGTCNDEKCLWQHINSCLLDSSNKIVDLLLYDPKLAGLTSEITDHIDMKVLHNIRQKLLQFAQKFISSNPQLSIEAQCREIASQIRNRSNESLVCLLTRRIPKLFSSSEIEVPFDELSYRFSLKDKSLVLNSEKISELRLSADPDIYFHNRFYAPEGVPISAELETSLASDPHNIQLWIKLAYYHITKCSSNNFADSIDRALNVLSRALEQNKTDPELYEHYLFIYSNRNVRNGEDSRFDLINICRKVVNHCPHYRVWKCFLSLCVSYEDKNIVSAQLLNNLINNIVINHSFETRSHQILEVIMFKIHLHLQQNNYNLSVLEFSEALNKSSEHLSNESQNPVISSINDFHYISDELTDSDRVFAWLCFTHLLIYHSLPAHCFQLIKQGFTQLINKNHFVFDWSALIGVINIEEIRKCLNIALELCYSTNQKDFNIDKNSFAIYINLAELNRYDTKHPNNNVYENLMKTTRNDSFLWPSIVEHRFKSNENHMNLIEKLKESPMHSSVEIKLCLTVANHYYEMRDFTNARNELLSIASIHYNCDIYFPILKLAFETLLFEDDENNRNFELINARKSKGSRSPILWLSYILLLKMDLDSEREIDSAFETALALCTIDKSSAVDLQLLWWNYLKFMMNNISNQKQFLDLLESVRHCCLTVSEPTFQLQIVNYFCEMLSSNDKLNALIQFAKLIPENVSVTMNAISFALQMNRKEMCWLLINSIIFDKKVRLQYLEFWKISIALAIERSDHLSVHKFFQIAISLMPYNKVLWETFKTYETSIKHVEHLKHAKEVCVNQIKICENIF